MTERTAIRLGIPALLVASTSSALAVSLHTAKSGIPSFYAALLLLVPLVRALTDGELPIELSLKGARWSEGMDLLSGRVIGQQTAEEKDLLTETVEMQREIETLRNILEEVTNYDGEHGGI